MNEDLSHLRDPETGQPLSRRGDSLVAPSGKSFEIKDGIPRFVPSENYAADFGAQWNRFPRTQLDSHTGLKLSEDRVARCFRGELETLRGKRVLEAGSGAGRFTEVLLKHGAELDTFDYSAAVEANAANNGSRPFTLVQADIRAMPFAPASYDYVVCLGVLQHTPDTEESIEKLWAMVRPGGRLIVDHYGWNLWKVLPPPLGDAEKLYRQIILRLPAEKRWPAVKRLVDFWFPAYWRLRDSRWARRILARTAGIHFYWGEIALGEARERYYEWSLLDTHDGMTDVNKRFRTLRSVRRTLERLGAETIVVTRGGNGVEAFCVKPARRGIPALITALSKVAESGEKDGELVTFAVITYRQERHIAEAVRSAFAQTYQPLQIILSDDCSDDQTFSIMDRMAADYAGPHEVLVSRNEGNLGLADHLNRVAELAKGAIIVLAAGDDFSHPDRTEAIVAEFARDARVKAVVSGYDIVDDQGRPTGSVLLPPDFETFTMPDTIAKKGGWVEMGAAWAYHRDCFVTPVAIREEILCEDRILPLRAALLGKIAHVRRQLLSYRRHDASATAQGRFRSPAYETIHQRILLEDLERLRASGTVSHKLYKKVQAGLMNYPAFLKRLARFPLGGRLARAYSALHNSEQLLRRIRLRIDGGRGDGCS